MMMPMNLHVDECAAPCRQRPSSLLTSEGESAQARSQMNLHPMYRKDFRIIGQIGEVGQKDKLNFTSLERQIEHGLKKRL